MELDEKRNRIVGVDTVISMLYRYHRESFCIVIKDKNNNVIGRFDLNTEANAPWRGKRENYDKRIDLFVQGKPGNINGVVVNYNGESGQVNPNDGSYTIAEKEFDTYVINNARFKEEFVEIQYNGIYMTGEDSSQITITPGGRTIYITYTEI